MNFEEYLRLLAANDGSDLYLGTGAPPCAKFQGALKPLANEPLKPGEIAAIANAILDELQSQQFALELEMNLAISIPGAGRFRINVFRQRNEVSIVARNITTEIPKFDDLGLPLMDGTAERGAEVAHHRIAAPHAGRLHHAPQREARRRRRRRGVHHMYRARAIGELEVVDQ
mgnify:CR=1 FL=1